MADPTKDGRWWTYPNKDQQHTVIHRLVTDVMRSQLWRRDMYVRFARLYNSASVQTWGGPVITSGPRERLAINVVKNCCDAFVSKLTQERPKIRFLTSDGDWDLREKAKDLEKFVDGQMYGMGIYDVMPRIVLDSCLYGTGMLHPYIDGEGESASIKCEKVPMWEMFTDELDAIHGDPRAMFRRKLVDKLWAIDRFPDFEDEIEACMDDHSDELWPVSYDTTAEKISLYVAHHLPSGPDAKDGRMAICIPNKTLYSGEWKHDYFPYVPYRRSWAPFGYWGIGLADELYGIQLELNALAQKIQRHHYLLGAGHWLVERNSKVQSGHLDNDITIINYTGTAPQVVFPQTVSGDIYQHFDRLYAKAYEITGISQLAASSQKPAGLNSGKALDAFADITSERFATAVHAYHDFYKEVAKQVIDLARQITAEDNPKYSATSVSRTAREDVEFLSVDLDKSEAVLQMYPISLLSKDPAEKLSQVSQLKAAFPDKIDDETAISLLDYEDVLSATSEITASDDLTRKIVTKILKEGKYIQPRPLMNLERASKIAQMMELKAELAGAAEDRLAMVRQWILQVEKMRAPPPPPPAPPGPPMGPGGGSPMGGPPMTGAPPGPMPPGGPTEPAPPMPEQQPPMAAE